MRSDRSGSFRGGSGGGSPRRRARSDSQPRRRDEGPASRPRGAPGRPAAGSKRRSRASRTGPPGPEPTRHPTRAAVIGGRAKSQPSRGDVAEAWYDARDSAGQFDAAALVRHAEWASLVPSIESAGADPATALPRLAEYIASVLSWNRSVSNLISASDESRLVSRHLAESLEPAGWLAESGARRWVDLGSGAGFPALPLAIIGVGEKWLLVESRRPKTLFLRRTTQQLGLTHVTVAHSRLEDLLHRDAQGEHDPSAASAGGFPFDAFTSRATLTLAPTLELAASSLRAGGHAFLWKGSARAAEKATPRAGAERWRDGGERELGSSQIAVCNFILIK